MEPTEGFYEFVTIAHEGSISGAARVLDVPRATLSRKLSGLEARLGTRLVHRSTRRLVLTRAGSELFRRADRIVREAKEAEAAIKRIDEVPRGVLRVSTPSFGANQGPMMETLFLDFMTKYPEVTLEVESTSRYVDLAAENVDVALRGGSVLDPSLIGRRVWDSDVVAYASPTYIEAHGVPSTLEELGEHECVLGFLNRQINRHWPLMSGGTVRVQGRLATNDIELRRQATLHGRGIAVLPRAMVEWTSAVGQLDPVLPGVVGSSGALWLVYVDREYLEPKVRVFIDHALETLRALRSSTDE